MWEEMAKLIDSGLTEKVSDAIAPFKERTENVEKNQLVMKEQVDLIIEQMKTVTEKLSSNSGQANLAPTWAQFVASDNSEQNRQQDRVWVGAEQQGAGWRGGVGDHHQDQVREIISLGRRTVGLFKIDQEDVERMRQEQYGGAQSEEEEWQLAVQEYLRCELKLDSNTRRTMEIEQIFPPYSGDFRHLWVTFKNESSVARIFERTRIMRPGSRIINYFPKQFKDRAKVIKDIEKEIRGDGSQVQTRIKVGLSDLELWKKARDGNHRWQRVTLPRNLPPVDLGMTAGSLDLDAMSPPPG